MRTWLLWIGKVSLVIGLLLIATNAVLYFKGISASFNIADSSKDQFLLISFWQIGAGLAILGVAAIFAGERS